MQILGEFRLRDGRIERRFTRAERKMLGNLVQGLLGTLELVDEPAGLEDPVLARLLPVAAPDNPDAAAEFAAATRHRIAASKAEAARALVADLEAAPHGTVALDDAGAVRWLRALGDLRLALVERAGFDSLQGGRTPQALVYGWLTWLQGSLVEAVDR